MSTYEERQAIRDANPGVIVDENSVYNPSTGESQSIESYTGGGDGGGQQQQTSGSTPGTGGGTVWVAADGQSLTTQTPDTQAMFRATWGDRAEQQWATEHNAALGAPPPTPQTTTTVATTPTGTTATRTTTAAPTTPGAQQYGDAISRLYEAIISGNAQRIQEEIRQFNATFGLDTQKFQEDIRQFNESLGIQQAGLTGQYQGAPTLPALTSYANQFGQWGVPTQGQATLAAQQQAYAQQLGLINQAASLQANPFRQQQAIGQMGNLLAGGGVASFSAPNTVAGVGTAGGNTRGGMGYLQQLIDDIRDPAANTTSMNSVLDATPTPNKLNSMEFLRSAPSTQSMVLQAMQEKYGLDPADSLKQIQATMPQYFQAPSMGGLKRV